MVCLGNICRSPLAEGILSSKITGLDIQVDSAGTAAYHTGEKPDARSMAVSQRYGIDISTQRARKFTVTDFDHFDKIYVMDLSNYKQVSCLARNEMDRSKIALILEELYPGENLEVPDPYYGGADGFQQVYDLLDKACDVLVDKIVSHG